MKINELETTDVMVGKTAAEQLLLLPCLFTTADSITTFYHQHTGPNNDELELIIEHQNTLILRDKGLNHTFTINTLKEDVSPVLNIGPEIMNADILDISTISTSVMTLHNVVTRDVYEAWMDDPRNCVYPLEGDADLIVMAIPEPLGMGEVKNKDRIVTLSVLMDEQVSEFDTLLTKIREHLPVGYEQPDDEFLIARTKTHCFILNKFTDKLMFIGEYKDEFLEKTKLLVSDGDIQVKKLDMSFMSKGYNLISLEQALRLAKDSGVTLEDVMRLALSIYDTNKDDR